MTEWIGVPKNLEDYQGFLYIIKNKINGRKYIGQKSFWKKIRRPPLKGKKQVRLCRVESDWKKYWGSCQELLDDIKEHGEIFFDREIYMLCKTKSELNYMEARFQFASNVLFDERFYNKIINVRINSNQLKKTIERMKKDG